MATPVPPESRGATQVGTVVSPGTWIIAGLAIAWVSGSISGIFFDSGDDGQSIFASVAALAGSSAAILLAVRHVRAGLDLSAAGFALFAIIGVASSAAGFTGPGADSVFASLALLHLAAMALIAAQGWSPVWARAGAALSGLVFAIYGYDFVLGDAPADPDSALLPIGYLLLLVAIVGWIMTLMAEGEGTELTGR